MGMKKLARNVRLQNRKTRAPRAGSGHASKSLQIEGLQGNNGSPFGSQMSINNSHRTALQGNANLANRPILSNNHKSKLRTNPAPRLTPQPILNNSSSLIRQALSPASHSAQPRQVLRPSRPTWTPSVTDTTLQDVSVPTNAISTRQTDTQLLGNHRDMYDWDSIQRIHSILGFQGGADEELVFLAIDTESERKWNGPKPLRKLAARLFAARRSSRAKSIRPEWHNEDMFGASSLVEVGIATLAVRDIAGTTPGKHCNNWLSQVRHCALDFFRSR